MESADGDRTALLVPCVATPIAQLGPDLPDKTSRAVRGEITITWPYNSTTKTLAFLLAEPDVRLRRAKGQIRIELCGPSAKAASECGLGAGDELLLGLDGAEWSKDASPGRIPGARADWQLRFGRKLVLWVQFGETGETKHINVDRPDSEQPEGTAAQVSKAVTPNQEPSALESQSPVRQIPEFPPNEYPSPAFVKRARLSYGALFEGGFDIFEDDGGIRGKGRKRTRFGRDSSAWRYSSQSPSPEPSSPVRDATEKGASKEITPQPSPRPQMMDEGCQAVEVEMAKAAPEPLYAATPQGGTPSEPQTLATAPQQATTAPASEETVTIQQDKRTSVPSALREAPAPMGRKEQVFISREESSVPSQATPVKELQQISVRRIAEEAGQERHITDSRQPSTTPTKDTEVGPSVLFGPTSLGSSFPSFGAAAPQRAEPTLSLADQVRFGFSHVPQTTRTLSPPRPEPASEPNNSKPEPYPASYLDDAPAPAKYADMNTYLNAADEQGERADQGQVISREPPAVERFGHDQWEMSTQSPHYNQVEGGHFGTDALDEGARITAGQPSLNADSIAPGRVPEGFASYGHEDVSRIPQKSRPEVPHEEQPFVENDDTVSEDEVGVEEDEDEDAEFDEYAYGERIEEGDYDQRNYDVPSDDDEGASEESDEIELEAEERYGNGEMYDEDGEGEEWDEEEEDYASEEEDYEEEDSEVENYQPRKNPALAPTGKPVVISLLSDSEDENEDEPAPQPKPVAAAAAPEPPTGTNGAPSLKRQPSPGVLETVETDGAVIAHAPENIFGQTHVIDFGARPNHSASEKARVLLAEPGAGAGVLWSAEKLPGSFATSDARDKSDAPAFEPAPSEGSSGGLFVSETMPESTPSEDSSEGLFISQPRVRSLDAEDQHTDGGSNGRPDETGGGSTDGDKELESEDREQSRAQEGPISIDEMEHDGKPSPRSSEGQNDDASLPDADNVSLASQVEMDEKLAESEDEYMSSEDSHAEAPVTGRAVLEIEKVAAPEEDVDMIDAGSAQIEPAATEEIASESIQKESVGATLAVLSEAVVEEAVSEAAPAVADDPATGAQFTEQQEAQDISPDAADRELAATERLQELVEDKSNLQIEKPVSDAQRQKGTVHSIPQREFEASSMAQDVQEHTQGSLAHSSVDDGVAPPAAPLLETGEGLPSSCRSMDGTQGIRSAERDRAAETQEDGIMPYFSSRTRQPTVVGLDETLSDDTGVELPSHAGQNEQEPAADEMESSARQVREPAASHQPTTLAEELEDETMILQQLTQEQSQSLVAEAAEARGRIRSSSPDLSVNLARQAVAARRQKKAPQPVRTSPRLTRARSNSLRSNTTPEREEDNSVSLARAALASPSRRGAVAVATATTPTPTNTAAALESELAKRLRTELPECVALKSLRTHVDKFPNAVAVVTSHPSTPTRARGGPREYLMSFRVTDPSVAPRQVVEVQMYRPHKESLPVVKPGDVVLLQRFQVKAWSGKGFGLRTGAESAWAVWDGGAEDRCSSPQIRGPPVEDWDGYVGYVGTLREWFRVLIMDPAARAKLEAADRKLAEAGGGGKK